jgi:hypothetical protein
MGRHELKHSDKSSDARQGQVSAFVGGVVGFFAGIGLIMIGLEDFGGVVMLLSIPIGLAVFIKYKIDEWIYRRD